MAKKIQIKRGLKQNLPTLAVAEFGLTTDTEEVFVGGNTANIGLAKASDVQAVTSQLAETTTTIKATNQGEKVNLDGGLRLGVRPKTPIITFTSDDGRVEDYTKIKPLFQSKGNIPLTMGLIPGLPYTNSNRTSISQIKELLGLGWEIASHTINHIQLGNASDKDIDTELRESKRMLEETFNVQIKHIIYPYGSYDSRVMKVARNYYRSGTSTDPGYNGDIHKTYALKRVALGSYFDVQNPDYPTTSSLEYYKLRVDEALANNGWLIFMMHPWNESHDATQMQYLSDLIDYIKSKNIPIMNIEAALDKVGNLMDVGVHGSTKGYFTIGSEGKTDANYAYSKYSSSGITNDSLLPSFPKDIVSTMVFSGGANAGFPEGAGTLETFYSSNEDFVFQKYYPYNNDTWYRRRWNNGTKAWLPWIKWDQHFAITSSTNAYTNNVAPLSLPTRKVIYTRITAAGADGYPSPNGGLLMTDTVAYDAGNIKQTFYSYNTNFVYVRSSLENNTWSDWEKNITRIGTTYNNFNFGTVPANGQVELTLIVPGIRTSDIVTVNPRSTMESGLMWNAYVSATDTLVVRVVNMTTTNVATSSRLWTIGITR